MITAQVVNTCSFSAPLCSQLPLGDGNQGSHEEVPQSHESQRCRSRCPGQETGHRWPPSQPPATEHGVGPAGYSPSGQCPNSKAQWGLPDHISIQSFTCHHLTKIVAWVISNSGFSRITKNEPKYFFNELDREQFCPHIYKHCSQLLVER